MKTAKGSNSRLSESSHPDLGALPLSYNENKTEKKRQKKGTYKTTAFTTDDPRDIRSTPCHGQRTRAFPIRGLIVMLAILCMALPIVKAESEAKAKPEPKSYHSRRQYGNSIGYGTYDTYDNNRYNNQYDIYQYRPIRFDDYGRRGYDNYYGSSYDTSVYPYGNDYRNRYSDYGLFGGYAGLGNEWR
ncbi:hypothetical protein SK128_005099 [Halocaridina rubra]|uniref:Uncharacterized protein n=1 Tax=Halocaridina rubra TaxID=373956 RepID=A0AAN8XM06_HALRR